ncbi:MAG TPA: hypothetical protein PLB14_07500, partial [Smithellaceae bacterium]|nr:hypothetical protein [Smithellaceae bacterium]
FMLSFYWPFIVSSSLTIHARPVEASFSLCPLAFILSFYPPPHFMMQNGSFLLLPTQSLAK